VHAFLWYSEKSALADALNISFCSCSCLALCEKSISIRQKNLPDAERRRLAAEAAMALWKLMEGDDDEDDDGDKWKK
jgi:hypothetical protein